MNSIHEVTMALVTLWGAFQPLRYDELTGGKWSLTCRPSSTISSAELGEPVQGRWKVISVQQLFPPDYGGVGNGVPEEAKKGVWVIDAKKIVFTQSGGSYESNYTLNTARVPKSIDITPCNVPYRDAGTCEGTYSVDGNRMKVCYGVPGTKRPQSFKGEDGSILFLFVLERERGKRAG